MSVRRLFFEKHEEPGTLQVYYGWQIDTGNCQSYRVKVVQKNHRSVIRLDTVKVLIIGGEFFFSAEDALMALRSAQQVQVDFYQNRVTLINETLEKMRKQNEG